MKRKDSHHISKYLHGTFAEFFGSTTYDGIWVGKDSKIPNVNGIRLDLIEAIALGHDIGHTPFGHAGERYLSEVYFPRGLFGVCKITFCSISPYGRSSVSSCDTF